MTNPQTPQKPTSDIVRILQQIDDEYIASHRALYDMAIITQHLFITQRMENIANYVQETLQPVIGDNAAMDAIIAWSDNAASDVPGGTHAEA